MKICDNYVSYDVAKDLYEKHKRCIWCGKYVELGKRGVDWSVDHTIPFSVARWCASLFPEKYDYGCLVYHLSRKRNLSIMHPWCNKKKGDYVFNPMTLKSQSNMSNTQMRKYRELYEDVREVMDDYMSFKKDIFYKQKKKCYLCKTKTDINSMTLRRIRCCEPASAENACAICPGCVIYHKTSSET